MVCSAEKIKAVVWPQIHKFREIDFHYDIKSILKDKVSGEERVKIFKGGS